MAEMRRCIGSAKYGIEAHEGPIEDFPKQPSQKVGLGRMCRTHWNQYTTALRKAALERRPPKSSRESRRPERQAPPEEGGPEPVPPKAKRGRHRAEPAAEVEQEGAAG